MGLLQKLESIEMSQKFTLLTVSNKAILESAFFFLFWLKSAEISSKSPKDVILLIVHVAQIM